MPASFLESAPAHPAALLRLCFDLPGSIHHVAHLRKASRCYVESIGLAKADVDDLEMILGELSTNVVRHAKRGDHDDYHVSIEFTADRYIVHVIDQGMGFCPGDTPEPGTSRPDTLSETNEERIGGLGLVMIRAIADTVDIFPTDPHGTTVRAEKRIMTGCMVGGI